MSLRGASGTGSVQPIITSTGSLTNPAVGDVLTIRLPTGVEASDYNYMINRVGAGGSAVLGNGATTYTLQAADIPPVGGAQWPIYARALDLNLVSRPFYSQNPVVNLLFARPASGLFDASQPLVNVPSTSTPITSANSASGYQATTDANDIEVTVMNFWALIGNSNEQPSNTNLMFRVGAEIQNPNGTYRAVRLLSGGSETLTLPANVISTGKFRVETPILKGTNFRIKIYITAPDGTSAIQYPAHSNTDFNGTTLGPGSGEGARFNFSDLTMVLNGTGGWVGKTGSYINRPLMVTCSGATAAPKGVVLTGDSLTSGSMSAVASICHAANIPFINLARSGESQMEWPTRAVGRAKALSQCKTFFCGEAMNGFGAGLEQAKTDILRMWAQARAAGHTVIIQMTATPNTSGSSGYATEAEQNPQGPTRPDFNAWLRTMVGQPDGPTVLWDVARVTSSADGLKSKGGYVYDGIHFTQLGIDAIVATAAAENWAGDIV